MGKKEIKEAEEVAKFILGGLGKVRAEHREGLRIHLTMSEEHGPKLLLPHVTRLKERLPSFVLITWWRGAVRGVGHVFFKCTYPHSEMLSAQPKYPANLPYHLFNSPSHHETHGKYFIVSKVPMEHPHDNVGVQLTIRANKTSTRHTTDLDLVGMKGGKIVLAEVLNGRVSDIKAALIRKSEVWSALKSVGIPIDRVLLYVVVPAPRVFKREYLAEIVDILRDKGFSGTLWITNKAHSRHEEFAF